MLLNIANALPPTPTLEISKRVGTLPEYLIPQQITVMLVDDQPIFARAVQDLLADVEDIDFHYCSDPTQAIAIANEIAPTVILQDLIMPEVDGLMLLRFFRANSKTREIPIIVLSSKENSEIKAQSFAFGANDYLVKFPDRIELIARLRYHARAYHNLLKRYETCLIEEYNKELEKRVEQRTTELRAALANLQQTQAKLVHSEKMSSLGQLVAGVAHEINNPVNFIYGNLPYLVSYTQSLLKLIEVYQEEYPQPTDRCQVFSQDIDLDFITGDLPQIVNSMEIGATRIREIVENLRNFSRLDQAESKEVNIHEGLDSTLALLNHRLKAAKIEVIKTYDQNLPLIECYPGQLNQVFMNLLSNAVDVLEPLSSQQTRRITIATGLMDSERALIKISDNGPGIPPQVQHQIFNPFFTTKPVGKGTGLGLSISYQIITEWHRGSLDCISNGDRGSTFSITIPLKLSLKSP